RPGTTTGQELIRPALTSCGKMVSSDVFPFRRGVPGLPTIRTAFRECNKHGMGLRGASFVGKVSEGLVAFRGARRRGDLFQGRADPCSIAGERGAGNRAVAPITPVS